MKDKECKQRETMLFTVIGNLWAGSKDNNSEKHLTEARNVKKNASSELYEMLILV